SARSRGIATRANAVEIKLGENEIGGKARARSVENHVNLSARLDALQFELHALDMGAIFLRLDLPLQRHRAGEPCMIAQAHSEPSPGLDHRRRRQVELPFKRRPIRKANGTLIVSLAVATSEPKRK